MRTKFPERQAPGSERSHPKWADSKNRAVTPPETNATLDSTVITPLTPREPPFSERARSATHRILDVSDNRAETPKETSVTRAYTAIISPRTAPASKEPARSFRSTTKPRRVISADHRRTSESRGPALLA